MRPAAGRPTWVQLRPPSVERYTPLPTETFPRGQAEPVPTQTTSGSDGATATAPMEPTAKSSSETLVHETPAFSVFHTPPPVEPIQNSWGRPRIPVTVVTRPPREGPTMRKSKPVSTSAGIRKSAGTSARSTGPCAAAAAARRSVHPAIPPVCSREAAVHPRDSRNVRGRGMAVAILRRGPDCRSAPTPLHAFVCPGHGTHVSHHAAGNLSP